MDSFGVEPFFGRFRPGAFRKELAAIAQRADTGDRLVLIARGESGLRLMWNAAPSVWLRLLEVHRLCFVRIVEARTGRRWQGERPRRWPEWRMAARERRALAACDGVLSVSPAVETSLRESFRYDKPARVLSSGVDLGDVEPPGDDARDIDVLYMGKLDAAKGVDVAVRAMADLPGTTLVVVGGTPEQVTKGKALAEAVGAGDRVTWLGQVNPVEIPGLVRRARVGVCPLAGERSIVSYSFSSPMKVLEFLAGGAVVVASDLPSVRQLIAHEETALLVKPDDAAALADGLRRALTDEALRGRLRTAGRSRAGGYAWPVRAERLLDFAGEVSGNVRL